MAYSKESKQENVKSSDPLDKNPCGMCRANGLFGCKGHGGSGGGASGGEENPHNLSTTSDKNLSKTLYESITKSQLWAEDYDDDMLFYWHNPDSLISTTIDIGTGLMNISGIQNLSESNEQAQAELLNEIKKELEQFKKELGPLGNTIEFTTSGKELNIKISDKTMFDTFMQRLMDRNLLITDTVTLTHEIKPSTTSKASMDSLEEIQDRTHIPGIATAVLSEGTIRTQSVGVMNVNNPEEVTQATVFEAASLSKPVFAYVVLKLAQKGQIDLDKPLYEYFSDTDGFGPPEMRADENYKKLTARMVLSHQAGLPNEFTSPESLRYVSNVGDNFDYSGVAYQFLGEVVEKITSKSLETLAQEEFVKIGMTNSSFMPPTGCCLIKLPNDAPKPTPQSIQELLKNTSDRNAQVSIIYHQDKFYVAERGVNGQVQITEKDSNQVTEGNLAAMKQRFSEIPNHPSLLAKPIPIEARELPLVAAVVGHRPEHAATIAIGHRQDGSVNTSQRFYMVHPGGSLYTTATDYAKFLNACTEDSYIREKMFQPSVPSLKDRDTKAQAKNVSSDVLEQMSWGIGIGLQTNADGRSVAFHWGDNGTGRNLAAINLNTGKAIVCLTNSANGPAAFQAIAEPIVGDLHAISQWLSIREDLPMGKGMAAASPIKQQLLQEKNPVSTTDDTALEEQQDGEQRSMDSHL